MMFPFSPRTLTRTLAILSVCYSIAAAAFPQESRTPGGIALIPLNAPADKRPEAWYRGDRVLVAENTDPSATQHWIAVVGIPLTASTDNAHRIKAAGEFYYFDVAPKQYREQRLTVKNKRHVEPDPEDIKRWRRESTEMKAAFLSWNTQTQPITQFELPAQGPFSSPFGLKRFFNEQPRKPHSGLDIAAPQGAPITAPAAGTVVTVGNYFFNGNTVILDHGHGLTTLYCHMSRIDVKKGQQLHTGEQLGLVGSTGRVTGPHLHWSVSLNNTRVDPLLWLDQE